MKTFRTILPVLLAVALVAATGGCAQPQRATGGSLPLDASPREVIRAYFNAVAAGDAASADSFRTVYAMKRKALDTDRSLPRISDLRVTALGPMQVGSGRSPHLRQYAGVREATVTYRLLENTSTEYAGMTQTFVTIVKETTASPWRIDELGSAP